MFLLFLSLQLADVFEEVLEIVSYMTFVSPTISLEMWSLWPLMVDALNDWAIDYFESKCIHCNVLIAIFYILILYSHH